MLLPIGNDTYIDPREVIAVRPGKRWFEAGDGIVESEESHDDDDDEGDGDLRYAVIIALSNQDHDYTIWCDTESDAQELSAKYAANINFVQQQYDEKHSDVLMALHQRGTWPRPLNGGQ